MRSAECEVSLKDRTRRLAIDVIAFVESLPQDRVMNVLGTQLLRCGTSVGANYRAACRARSRADFISKMGIVEEEADETGFWVELLLETGRVELSQVRHLVEGSDIITAMAVSSIRTARSRKTVR
jgi:four helix bundle protein